MSGNQDQQPAPRDGFVTAGGDGPARRFPEPAGKGRESREGPFPPLTAGNGQGRIRKPPPRRSLLQNRRPGRVPVLGLFLVLLTGGASPVSSGEYEAINDFHLSVREAFNSEYAFQVDNYVSLDAYRVFDRVDFHVALLFTNDLNLTGRAAAQLTLAYLSAEQLLGSVDLEAGRQFFAQGFDGYVGDGVKVGFAPMDFLRCFLHAALPFDAESEAIDDVDRVVYGGAVELGGYGTPFPVRASFQAERREALGGALEAQTLLGLEAVAEMPWAWGGDVYADVEYQTESSRLRRVKAGSLFYPSPSLSCRLEAERFDPDPTSFVDLKDDYFQDTITNLFTRSAVTGGSLALTYHFGGTRALRLRYTGQYYTQRVQDDDALGNGVDLYVSGLAIPALRAVAGCGYSGRFVDGDTLHLGIGSLEARPFDRTVLTCRAESGVIRTRDWGDELVLYLRMSVRYRLLSSLNVSVALEENRNPYFDSDFRGMLFLNYAFRHQGP